MEFRETDTYSANLYTHYIIQVTIVLSKYSECMSTVEPLNFGLVVLSLVERLSLSRRQNNTLKY